MKQREGTVKGESDEKKGCGGWIGGWGTTTKREAIASLNALILCSFVR